MKLYNLLFALAITTSVCAASSTTENSLKRNYRKMIHCVKIAHYITKDWIYPYVIKPPLYKAYQTVYDNRYPIMGATIAMLFTKFAAAVPLLYFLKVILPRPKTMFLLAGIALMWQQSYASATAKLEVMQAMLNEQFTQVHENFDHVQQRFDINDNNMEILKAVHKNLTENINNMQKDMKDLATLKSQEEIKIGQEELKLQMDRLNKINVLLLKSQFKIALNNNDIEFLNTFMCS